MTREENDEDWTLFDPADVRELTETWGTEFEEHYIRYEEEFRNNPSKFNPNTRVIKAKDIMRECVISYNNEG